MYKIKKSLTFDNNYKTYTYKLRSYIIILVKDIQIDSKNLFVTT